MAVPLWWTKKVFVERFTTIFGIFGLVDYESIIGFVIYNMTTKSVYGAIYFKISIKGYLGRVNYEILVGFHILNMANYFFYLAIYFKMDIWVLTEW